MLCRLDSEPNLEDDVTPEGDMSRALRLGGDEGGFVGIDAVVANGLSAFGWIVVDGGGDLFIAIGVVSGRRHARCRRPPRRR